MKRVGSSIHVQLTGVSIVSVVAKWKRSLKKPSKNSRTTGVQGLKRKLDKVFSQYIRLRDMDRSTGLCRCVTCGLYRQPKEIDCGHFAKRQHLATRYDPQNCYAQCKGCNNYEQGAEYRFAKAIDKMHGEGTAEWLLQKSRLAGKYPRLWFEAKLEEWQKRLKELKAIKGDPWER